MAPCWLLLKEAKRGISPARRAIATSNQRASRSQHPRHSSGTGCTDKTTPLQGNNQGRCVTYRGAAESDVWGHFFLPFLAKRFCCCCRAPMIPSTLYSVYSSEQQSIAGAGLAAPVVRSAASS